MTKRKRYNAFEQPKRRGPAPSPDAPVERPNMATINLEAGAGKQGLSIGDLVRIEGSGMYAGETATIERLTTGAIPSAVVRTKAGNTRHVRTIDLSTVRAPQE
jgi:hypothetical protein